MKRTLSVDLYNLPTISLLFALGGCIPAPTIPPAPQLLTEVFPTTTEATHVALPSTAPQVSRSPALPPADPSLRLMFATQQYNYEYFRPTVPAVAFARPDRAPIPAPAWADDLLQAAGDFLTWSADGRYLAFDGYNVDEEGRVEIPRGQTAPGILLLIAEPATGDLFTALPEGFYFNRLAGGPTWSPDGAQLAIPLSTHSTMGKEAIHIVRPNAGQPQQITPPRALFPSWSPVDNRLAYLEYAPADPLCPPFYPDDFDGCDQVTLKLVDIDSGAVSTLLEGVHASVEIGGYENKYNAPVWSPDGQWLVVFRGDADPDLVAVNAESGEGRILTRTVDKGAYIAVAPDGGAVAYVSRATGNDEIVLVPWAGGAQQNLSNDLSSDINPVWSADGRFIAFLSDRGLPGRGYYHAYTLDLISREVSRVSQEFVLTRPAWVPTSVP